MMYIILKIQSTNTGILINLLFMYCTLTILTLCLMFKEYLNSLLTLNPTSEASKRISLHSKVM